MNTPHTATQQDNGELSPVPERILKRNLQDVDFDRLRLEKTLSTIRQQYKEFSREHQQHLEAQILRQLKHKQAGAPYPSVLQLQDAIEHSLFVDGYFKSARYFINHRAEKRILRQQRHRLRLLIQAMAEITHENSQKNTTSPSNKIHQNWQALCHSLFEQILNQVLKTDSQSLEISEDVRHSMMQLPAEILMDLLARVEDKLKA
ncbi:MAG: hypothetical protein OQK49_04565 [Proteobacteria bacterium]|nr:hypothetical protein [Pseudomonadota bacterium]